MSYLYDYIFGHFEWHVLVLIDLWCRILIARSSFDRNISILGVGGGGEDGVAVLVEESGTQRLGEDVSGIVFSGDGEEFEVPIVDLFSDVVVSKFDVAGAGCDDGVAGEFDGAMVVDVDVGVPFIGTAVVDGSGRAGAEGVVHELDPAAGLGGFVACDVFGLCRGLGGDALDVGTPVEWGAVDGDENASDGFAVEGGSEAGVAVDDEGGVRCVAAKADGEVAV